MSQAARLLQSPMWTSWQQTMQCCHAQQPRTLAPLRAGLSATPLGPLFKMAPAKAAVLRTTQLSARHARLLMQYRCSCLRSLQLLLATPPGGQEQRRRPSLSADAGTSQADKLQVPVAHFVNRPRAPAFSFAPVGTPAASAERMESSKDSPGSALRNASDRYVKPKAPAASFGTAPRAVLRHSATSLISARTDRFKLLDPLLMETPPPGLAATACQTHAKPHASAELRAPLGLLQSAPAAMTASPAGAKVSMCQMFLTTLCAPRMRYSHEPRVSCSGNGLSASAKTPS
jgi:hypothetical protein